MLIILFTKLKANSQTTLCKNVCAHVLEIIYSRRHSPLGIQTSQYQCMHLGIKEGEDIYSKGTY